MWKGSITDKKIAFSVLCLITELKVRRKKMSIPPKLLDKLLLINCPSLQDFMKDYAIEVLTFSKFSEKNLEKTIDSYLDSYQDLAEKIFKTIKQAL